VWEITNPLPTFHPPPAGPKQNDSVERFWPKHLHRDDVGLLWTADISARDGCLRRLQMTPMRLR
jgi:hypothetical protein